MNQSWLDCPFCGSKAEAVRIIASADEWVPDSVFWREDGSPTDHVGCRKCHYYLPVKTWQSRAVKTPNDQIDLSPKKSPGWTSPVGFEGATPVGVVLLENILDALDKPEVVKDEPLGDRLHDSSFGQRMPS
jgi:hypothetical protein